jgi:sn-glycerol 3-phosphate transport system ATP-binding protein
MSVRKNMAYSLKIRKIPQSEIDRRVEEAAEILELSPFLERKPRQLSGGQRQRVAMGRAIVRDPQVFLFDEPLSNLDAKLRVQMRLEIRKLQKRLGVTSIYVTHDQVEAMTLGDRLMVLNAGRVEQFDTPIALYERPASMFVAGFIGSPAMNFLPATIENGALTLENKTVLPGPTVAAGAVIIGIRPEHLVQRPDGPLAVRIEMLEHLGANTLVHGVLEGTTTPIVVSIDGLQTLPTNAILCFAPKEGQIHMFDRQTEVRLPV